MKLHWLRLAFLEDRKATQRDAKVPLKGASVFLSFAFYFLLLVAPAQAARLEFWRFDSNQNRLEFTTDEGVQPRAQLIANPTRLVIDLPGISLGRSAITQPYSGAIRSIRIGQFDRQTTRLVVELAPGYTLDPTKVQFRGLSPRQWTVQLPTPQFVPSLVGTTPTPTVNDPGAYVVSTVGIGNASATARTQIQNIQPTPDGFFVRTSGDAPIVQVNRSADRRQIQVDFQGTALAATLPQRDWSLNQNGVSRLQVTQAQAAPPLARLTLSVNPNSPDWQVRPSPLGGLVLLPQGVVSGGIVSGPPPSTPIGTPVAPTPRPLPAPALATIQSVSLENGGTQLLVRSDRPVTYTSGWDRATGAYRMTLSGAQLAPNVQGPRLEAGSPVLQVRLRQEDARTVAILLQPASGVQFGPINQPGRQLLALQIQRSRPVVVQPPVNPSVPTPDPPPTTQPRVPNGRLVVVIDPGHGGPDPGAVGIGGIQEKSIVLDISRQVADLLERQGVQAILTRSDDRDLDLEPRVRMAEQANATVFVSIHANSISMSRPDISGLETYYYDSGLQLARTIHNSILQGTDVRDRGVRRARFYVLRRTSMPAVLVETGFVTGREDAARLSSPNYRRQMAAAIARGILQYIRNP